MVGLKASTAKIDVYTTTNRSSISKSYITDFWIWCSDAAILYLIVLPKTVQGEPQQQNK